MDHGSPLPRLYAIADTVTIERGGWRVEQVVEAWIEAGVRLIQLRHKGHYSREMFETARRVSVLCRAGGAALTIDDRADIANLVDAGVHVGQDDLAPADARRVLGTGRLLGFSTHNEAQLKAGDAEPVDYLALGPMFPTGSKANPDPVVGLDRMAQLRRLTAKPLVAIGGITLERAPLVLRAGFDSVAVISGLLPPGDEGLRRRAEEWIEILTDVL